MDKIKIKDLEVYANHGVFPEEQALGQKFLISGVLYVDLSKAARSGDLKESVHYGKVCRLITNYAKDQTFALIETLAEKLAAEILKQYPQIQRVKLEVEKPWAPIGLPLDTVSVEVDRRRHSVYIALGSNLGDKQAHLETAVKALRELDDFEVKKVSDFIVTAPYGGVEQDDFLNGVLEGETTMDPFRLLEVLHDIEAQAGRTRDIHWGPRTLDLDILFYDDQIIDSEELVIPHKELHLRRFVLEPLAQIAPWKRHPLNGKTVEEMLRELP